MRIFSHPCMADHTPPEDIAESPARLVVIRHMIETEFPDIEIENAAAARLDDILLAHTRDYLDSLQTETTVKIDNDTYIGKGTFDAAMHAAGAAIKSVETVLSDDKCNTAFALTRPPGHHAGRDTAEGFCFLNNAFIAARSAIRIKPDCKVLIIDFDVHHGNGTQSLVASYVSQGDENIAYASIHQEGIYPQSGFEQSEFIYNCPLLAGSGSADFRDSITYDILPFAKRFAPDLIIFSAGFDGHKDDDIARLNYTHEDFAWIVEQFKPLCKKQVSVLEGGYHLGVLPVSLFHHLKALAKAL